MATNIITLEDLQNFKQELVTELQKLLSETHSAPARRWLKSREVRELLMLSPNTLQHLRISGTLPFTKIGGIFFYDYDDIQKMIKERKLAPHFNGKKLNA